MFLIFSFLHFPCKFFFFSQPCFPEPNLTCDPINENDFERRIVWSKHREDPTNTLEMASVFFLSKCPAINLTVENLVVMLL